jgi:hypothetical protein
MKRNITILLLTLLAVLVGCSNEYDDIIFINENNKVSVDMEYESDSSLFFVEDSIIENEIEEILYPHEPIMIQNFFEPIDAVVFSHNINYPTNIPDFIRFNPFGEIFAKEVEGMASYVIFIVEGYHVKSQDNLLQITPFEDEGIQPNNVPVFMEITQVPNITVEEMEQTILRTIDFDLYPINHHWQPTDSFPYVQIQLHNNRRNDSVITTTYIRDNTHGGVFVITTQYSAIAWSHRSDLNNSLKTLKTIILPEDLLLIEHTLAESLHEGLPSSIENLYKPKYAIIYLEGMPELVKYYPFGEIVKTGIDGMTSYVIYIEDFFQVEQQENLLRVTPTWNMPIDWPDVFLEIKQIPNITVAEMEQNIISITDFNRYEEIFHNQSREDFPFVSFNLYEGLEWDSTVVCIFIKDNKNGGVFVITSQYINVAAEGHGTRFSNILRTLEIIENNAAKN